MSDNKLQEEAAKFINSKKAWETQINFHIGEVSEMLVDFHKEQLKQSKSEWIKSTGNLLLLPSFDCVFLCGNERLKGKWDSSSNLFIDEKDNNYYWWDIAEYQPLKSDPDLSGKLKEAVEVLEKQTPPAIDCTIEPEEETGNKTAEEIINGLTENEFLDLSDQSEEFKSEYIQGLLQLSAKELMKAFYSFKLQTHMDLMVVNENDGEEFILTFRKASHHLERLAANQEKASLLEVLKNLNFDDQSWQDDSGDWIVCVSSVKNKIDALINKHKTK